MKQREYHDLSVIPFHCGQHLAYLGRFFPLQFHNFRHPTIRFDVSNCLSHGKLKCVTRNHKCVCLLLCLGGSIGHVYECSTVHYFGIPTHTQSMIDFDRVLLEIPVQNCIVGVLLTCPIDAQICDSSS